MLRKFEYQLFADYYQFYLQDESVSGDLSNSWTEEAVNRLLAVAPGTLGVGTVRNMTVPVVVEVSDREPDEDTTGWDQVNECTLEVPSGRIVVAGCTDYFPDAARIDVSPGTYKARLYYGNLSALGEDGLKGDDRYQVVLWPGSPGPLRVIKQRSLPSTGHPIR
jgi:hypothetical protein